MATTLPTLTRTIDNAFTQTWWEIRPDAIDNILNALVVWNLLKAKGCFQTQVGGEVIGRKVKYAVPTGQVVAVGKGDTLPMGEEETETMAYWKWRYLAAPVQRSLTDDQQNAGKFKIVSYVERRLKEAREALSEVCETGLDRATDTTETGHKYFQSLNDIVVAYASRATGTFGGIARSNTWWQNKYKTWTLPLDTNLLADMTNHWNTIGANKDYPDIILTTQTIYELYEDYALDQTQIVKSDSADLGFRVLKFKGADLTWSPNVTAGTMKMLTSKYIELMHDPNYWFQMSEWKPFPTQLERLAHIILTGNLICTRLNKQGLIYTA